MLFLEDEELCQLHTPHKMRPTSILKFHPGLMDLRFHKHLKIWRPECANNIYGGFMVLYTDSKSGIIKDPHVVNNKKDYHRYVFLSTLNTGHVLICGHLILFIGIAKSTSNFEYLLYLTSNYSVFQFCLKTSNQIFVNNFDNLQHDKM